MKYVLLLILQIAALFVYSQADTTLKPAPGTNLPLDNAYLSEVKKLGNMAYADINLNIGMRKERNFSTGAISKSLYFSGNNAEGPCEGYIDMAELKDAVQALYYVIDSLLTRQPDNEMHFAKRFNNSSFVIYASFNPTPAAVFARNDWDLTLQLNEHDYTNGQGLIHIKRGDIRPLLKMFIAAQEKLPDF